MAQRIDIVTDNATISARGQALAEVAGVLAVLADPAGKVAAVRVDDGRIAHIPAPKIQAVIEWPEGLDDAAPPATEETREVPA